MGNGEWGMGNGEWGTESCSPQLGDLPSIVASLSGGLPTARTSPK